MKYEVTVGDEDLAMVAQVIVDDDETGLVIEVDSYELYREGVKMTEKEISIYWPVEDIQEAIEILKEKATDVDTYLEHK